MRNKLDLNFGASICGTVNGQQIVDDLVGATKAYMSGVKLGEGDLKIKKNLIEFCANSCKNLATFDDYDPSTANGFANLMKNPYVNSIFFSAITSAMKKLSSKEEVTATIPFANILNGAEGDSANVLLSASTPFQVEISSRSNGSTVHQYRYNDNVAIEATVQEASFGFDVYQFHAYNTLVGEMLANLVKSFRIDDLQKVCNAVFDTTDLTSTPFYMATFDDVDYIELAERVAAANGGNSVAMAYGTKVSLFKASKNVVTGVNAYNSVDEMVRSGAIKDILGVPSKVLDQAVDSANNYSFRVPNDKIILAPANAKIATLFIEGSYDVAMPERNAILGGQYQILSASGAKATPNALYGMVYLG